MAKRSSKTKDTAFAAVHHWLEEEKQRPLQNYELAAMLEAARIYYETIRLTEVDQ